MKTKKKSSRSLMLEIDLDLLGRKGEAADNGC